MPSSSQIRVAAGALALTTLLACSLLLAEERPDAPPQGWWSKRGPVVPHETFPADCSVCHVGATWHEISQDFQFDHLAETGVALEGAHARAECLRCHNDRGPVALFADKGCSGCHEDVHRGQLGKNCGDCHRVEDWGLNEAISIHDRTRFPLVGAHAATACFRCHEGAQVGEFTRADTECVTCHQDDLARAEDPDHIAQGWVADCDRCHIPTTWTGAGYNHSAFPLTGAHLAAQCTDCHAGSVFAGTPSACAACHQSDYDATTSPDHAAASFSLSCESCHGTATWSGASFLHTSFPLTGAHLAVACTTCHAGGVYAGTPSACVACHQSDYDGTTDPPHQSSGFPTDCASCHGTSMWEGAVFNHSFPITTGKHKSLSCSDCHLVPGSPSSFSCTHCHEHIQSEADPQHKDVSGYSWSSPACLSCHPNGKS